MCIGKALRSAITASLGASRIRFLVHPMIYRWRGGSSVTSSACFLDKPGSLPVLPLLCHEARAPKHRRLWGQLSIHDGCYLQAFCCLAALCVEVINRALSICALQAMGSQAVSAGPRRCVEQATLTQMARKGGHFRCPQHYCAACGRSGDGMDMAKCIRCCAAYHSICMSGTSARRLHPHSKVPS